MLTLRKKALAVGAALAMSVSVLAGCGNSSSSSADAGLGTKDNPVTLSFWTWQPTDAQWKGIYKKFQEKYPNIKIKWWRTAEQADYQKKLQTAMAGGEGPDLFGVQTGTMATEYARFADDMNDLADENMPGWKDKVSENAVKQVTTTDGKLAGMPTIISGQEYLLYNKTLLKENGITTLPTTYDELKADCAKLKDKGLIPMAFGAKDGWHDVDFFVWMSNQFGKGDIYKAEEGKASFTDKTFVKTMNAWKQMVGDKVFQDGAVGTATYPDARDNYFYSRKTAFFPTGSWHASVAIPNDETKGTAVENDELGMIQFPSVGDGKAEPTTGVDFALSVNKTSKKKKAAMKFVEFMTTGEGQQLWINTLQGSPVAKGMEVQLPSDVSQTAKDSVSEITKGQLNSTLERKLKYSELEDEIGVQMQNVYNGTSVNDALAAIQKVNEGLDRS